MKYDFEKKSSVEEIRKRFDADVERFSNLSTGQVATVDAAISMELMTQAAFNTTQPIHRILDIGCGAGNMTLKMLQLVPTAHCDLLDLSRPMLDKAIERVTPKTEGKVCALQSDFRTVDLPDDQYDVILAAAVFHHLRDDNDWISAFSKLFRLLRKGGSVWISDLVSQDIDGVFNLMWKRYGEYLLELGGPEYRAKVEDYIEQEDTPRSVTWQMDLFRQVGFSQVEILHKNSCYATFGAMK